MLRRQDLEAVYAYPVSQVFAALGLTLAFRRWGPVIDGSCDPVPVRGHRYRCRAGSVLRLGRVVDVTRPVGLTLKELLHDPPCRVSLILRWRIEPVGGGSLLRLNASYRFNHAARLRRRHWDRRLRANLERQLEFVAVRLERMQDASCAKRESAHL